MQIQKDKLIHFQVCALIALLVTLIIGALNAPIITASLAGYLCAVGTGLGKEYGDKINPYNKWDWYDVVADIVGGITGSILAVIILYFI